MIEYVYAYIDEVKQLMIQYMKELNRDLSFQDFDNELNHLSQKYSQQGGCLLVAKDQQKVIGCIAFHPFTKDICEMKRLYVLKEYRKQKIGYRLVEALIEEARKQNYRTMVLDTIKPLKSAIALYQRFGFKETKPYYDNPMDDVIYMELTL